MRIKSSIITIIALSSISFAGGDIGGTTTFQDPDYINAEVEAVEEDLSGGGDVVVTPPQEQEPQRGIDIKKEPPKVTTNPPIKTDNGNTKKDKDDVQAKSDDSSGSSLFGFGDGNLYMGVAVSAMATRLDDQVNIFSDEDYQDRQLGVTLVLGYDFMDYLGAELRVALAVDGADGDNDDMQQFGIYLKPKYVLPVMDNKMSVYGLLGYSMINMSDDWDGVHEVYDGDNDGVSFGVGFDYGVTENISVFTDYVNYLRNYGATNSQWGANLGIKYNF